MARVVPRVPDLTDVLCERCGYVLNGLPETGRCPECGKPIQESIGIDRVTPAWEIALTPMSDRAHGFIQSSWAVIAKPTRFYRTFTARGPLATARSFATIHWWIASGLFGMAVAAHALWYWYLIEAITPPTLGGEPMVFIAMSLGMTVLTYLALDLTTRLAAKLTALEGTYRGYRLPYEIVLRGLYYHAAHYLPVAFAALVTVMGYQLLLALHVLQLPSAVMYLYVLSGQVVLSAFYLFETYWVGMRNMMYANR